MMILAARHYDTPSIYYPIWARPHMRCGRSCASQLQQPSTGGTCENKKKQHCKRDEINRSMRSAVFQRAGLAISENESSFIVSLDVPGVKLADTQVDVIDGGILRIQSKRTTGKSYEQTRFFRFDESTVDTLNVKANLVDGVLSITLPKKEKVVSHPVSIKVTKGYAPTEDEDSPKKSILTMDIPGVTEADMTLQFHEGKIIVKAERRRGDALLSKLERSVVFDQKNIDTSKLEAYLADGVLNVVAPERQAVAPLSVSITTERAQDVGSELKSLTTDNSSSEGDDSSAKGEVFEQEAVRIETASDGDNAAESAPANIEDKAESIKEAHQEGDSAAESEAASSVESWESVEKHET